MNNKKLFIVVGIILIAIFALSFSRGNKPIEVKEVEIKNRIVQRTVSASGIVKSRNEANLAFASLGRIYNLTVEKGDTIEKGKHLASIDSYSDAQTAQSLKDARDIALRDRDLFIEQYETNKDAVSGSDEYDILLRKENEKVSRAEAAYQAQLGSLTNKYINSPFDGTVIDVFKEEGETALAGETILKVADLDNLIFEIELDQEDFGLLKENQKVEIELDAFPSEVFEGYITSLPTYVDSDTGTDFVIEIDLNGSDDKKILLGMTGDANIVLAETENPVPSLTFDEILFDIEDKPYLLVLDDDKVKKLDIELGLEGDIYYELKSNIDSVVVMSSDDTELEEGDTVTLN